MRKLTIRTPIWGSRSIGINLFGCGKKGDMMIDISYRDKNNQLLFPGIFQVPISVIREYPTQDLKQVTLYLMPKADLDQYEIENELPYE